MVGLSQMKSSDSNAQLTQSRPLTSAKMTTVNYKDARNARKQKKAEEITDQPATELIFEEDFNVFERLNARGRAFTAKI